MSAGTLISITIANNVNVIPTKIFPKVSIFLIPLIL